MGIHNLTARQDLHNVVEIHLVVQGSGLRGLALTIRISMYFCYLGISLSLLFRKDIQDVSGILCGSSHLQGCLVPRVKAVATHLLTLGAGTSLATRDKDVGAMAVRAVLDLGGGRPPI